MTVSDTPWKRGGRPRKPPVARALRRIRNKDAPGRCASHVHFDSNATDGSIEQAIDTSLVAAQKTIRCMVIDAVHHDACNHMVLYMLQNLVGHALALTRLQRQMEPDDA